MGQSSFFLNLPMSNVTEGAFHESLNIREPQLAEILDNGCLLLLVTMFVYWPTFILGSCDKVAA